MYPDKKKSSSYGEMNRQSPYQNQQYYRSGYDHREMNTNQDMRGGYQHGYQQIHQGPPRSPYYHHQQDHRSPSGPPRSEPRKMYGTPQGYNRNYNNHGSSNSGYRQHHTPTKSPGFGYNSNRGPKKPSDHSKTPLSRTDESLKVASKDQEIRKDSQNSKQVSFATEKTMPPQKPTTAMDSLPKYETPLNVCESSHSGTGGQLTESRNISQKNEFKTICSAEESNDKGIFITKENTSSVSIEDFNLKKCELAETSNENNGLNLNSHSLNQQLPQEKIDLNPCSTEIQLANSNSEVIEHSEDVYCEIVESVVEVISHYEDIEKVKCSLDEPVDGVNAQCDDEPVFEVSTQCDVESFVEINTECDVPAALVNSQHIELVEPVVEMNADNEVELPAVSLSDTDDSKLVLLEVVNGSLSIADKEQVSFDACSEKENTPDKPNDDSKNCELDCLKTSLEKEKNSFISNVSSSEQQPIQESSNYYTSQEKDVTHGLQNLSSDNYSNNEDTHNKEISNLPEIVESIISTVMSDVEEKLDNTENIPENIKGEVKSLAHQIDLPTAKQEAHKTPMKNTIDNELTGKLNEMYITPARSSRKSRALIDSTNIVESSSIAYVTREVKHKEAPSEVIITPVRRSTRKKAITPGPQELSQEKIRAAKVVPNPFLNA